MILHAFSIHLFEKKIASLILFCAFHKVWFRSQPVSLECILQSSIHLMICYSYSPPVSVVCCCFPLHVTCTNLVKKNTNKLSVAESIFRSWQLLRYSRNSQHFIFKVEVGGSRFLRKVSNFLQNYMVSHPRLLVKIYFVIHINMYFFIYLYST